MGLFRFMTIAISIIAGLTIITASSQDSFYGEIPKFWGYILLIGPSAIFLFIYLKGKLSRKSIHFNSSYSNDSDDEDDFAEDEKDDEYKKEMIKENKREMERAKEEMREETKRQIRKERERAEQERKRKEFRDKYGGDIVAVR